MDIRDPRMHGPERERWRQALSEALGGHGGGMHAASTEGVEDGSRGRRRGRRMHPTATGTCTPQAHAFHRHMHPTGMCTPHAHAPHRHTHPASRQVYIIMGNVIIRG